MKMGLAFSLLLILFSVLLGCGTDKVSNNNSVVESIDNLWVSPYGARYRDSIYWQTDSIKWTSFSDVKEGINREAIWILVAHEPQSPSSGRYYMKLSGGDKFSYLDYTEKTSEQMVVKMPLDTFPTLDEVKKVPFTKGVDPKLFLTSSKLNSLKPANPEPPIEETMGVMNTVIERLDHEKYESRLINSRFRKKILDQIVMDYYYEQGIDPFEGLKIFEANAFKEQQEYSSVVIEKVGEIRAKIAQKLTDAGIKLD